MPFWATCGIFALVAWGIAWLLPAERPVGKTLRILALLAIPVMTSVSWYQLHPGVAAALAVIAAGFMLWEVSRPTRDGRPYLNDENIINAGYLMGKVAGASLLWGAYYALRHRGAFYEPEWGLWQWRVGFWEQGLIAIVVLDLKQYWVHRLQHRFSIWWRFHQIHHSTSTMSLMAAGRTHFLEWAVMQIGSSMLVFHFAGFGRGAVIHAIAMQVISGSFSHLNVTFDWKRVPWWGYAVATPNYHAFHHQLDDDRHNYAEIFPLWDILFGTFRAPLPAAEAVGTTGPSTTGVLRQHLYPFTHQATRAIRGDLTTDRASRVVSSAHQPRETNSRGS